MVGSWAELIAIILLLLFMGGCVFGALRWDARLKAQEASFWQELARDGKDFVAVLLTERFVFSFPTAVHITQVVMKGRAPQSDKVIYHNNSVRDITTAGEDGVAFGRWIDTAESQNLPAVYQLYSCNIRLIDERPGWRKWLTLTPLWSWSIFGRQLGVLSKDQIGLIRVDPVDYVIRFFRYVRVGRPLPDPPGSR